MAIEQTITLSAIGGDAAASEIAKTSQALNSVTQTSSGMESQFSHRFTHVGLMMFGQDMLRTSGLATEGRQIIGLLTTSIFAAGSAFGAAAGPVMLLGGALLAVAGVYEKVSSKTGESLESLTKSTAANEKEMNSLDETTRAMRDYIAAGGTITQTQRDFLTATEKLSADLKANQIDALQKTIVALEANRQKIIDHAQTLAGWHQYIADVKVVWDALVQGFETSIWGKVASAIIEVDKETVRYWSDLLGLHAAAAPQSADLKNMTDALDKNAQATAKARMELEALRTGHKTDFDQMTKDVNAYTQNSQRVIDAYYTELKKQAADAAQKQKDFTQTVHDFVVQKNADQVKEIDKANRELGSKLKGISDQIGGDFGNAFSQMIVEGKSFTEAMQQAFTRMAEQMIADIIRIIAEQEILLALETVTGTTGWGGVGGAIFGGAHAAGGSVMVDKPTLFLAGEAGPELATFSPAGSPGNKSSGQGGGVGQVTINLSVDHIEGNNPSGTLDLLADEVRKETVSGRRFASTVSGVAGRYPNAAY